MSYAASPHSPAGGIRQTADQVARLHCGESNCGPPPPPIPLALHFHSIVSSAVIGWKPPSLTATGSNSEQQPRAVSGVELLEVALNYMQSDLIQAPWCLNEEALKTTFISTFHLVTTSPRRESQHPFFLFFSFFFS